MSAPVKNMREQNENGRGSYLSLFLDWWERGRKQTLPGAQDTLEPALPVSITQVPNPEVIDLIDVANDLQNKIVASGHSLNISLPQIVVIGCQSAGKSSVLESFVGKEFLPRGTRLVTRRPIVVQLIPCSEEYGVFLHKDGEKFTDFDAIRQEIIRVTDEECGPTGFSKNPISLTIYSPRVLKLTVVDLPGIIRVNIDQEKEAIQTVRDMVLHYIKEDKCIILAVTPTGQDLANSDALELAKIVDPKGERTIGVLTKLDLMEEGTDARDILDNTHFPLKRGWVGVINRSSKDVAEGKDMQYILKKEKEFFQNNDIYSHMAHRMGTPYLQKLLQKTLRAHIKQCLPGVCKDIVQKLSKYQKELKEFDSIFGDGPNAKPTYMARLIQKFCEDINMKIMGYSEMIPTDVVTHGALINFKLHTEVQSILSQDLIPNEEEIITLIPSINGMRNSISIPSLVVDIMCRKLIERFKEPLDSSVTCIKETLLKAIEDSSTLLNTYPSLRNEVVYQINHWIEKECENTKDRLKEHVDAESFYINTVHPDFDTKPLPTPAFGEAQKAGKLHIGAGEQFFGPTLYNEKCDPIAPPVGPVKVWAGVNVKIDESDPDELSAFKRLLKKSPQMQKQVEYVAAIIIKYLEIIQKQISDTAVKYIAYFLVKKVLDSIKYDLLAIILDSPRMSSITEDWDDDIRRKEEMESTCNVLEEALEAIRSF